MKISDFYSESTEGITHQRDTAFTTRLDAICTNLLGDKRKFKEYAVELSNILYDRFGIRFNVVETKMNVSVEIPHIQNIVSPKYGVRKKINEKDAKERSEQLVGFIKKGKLTVDEDKVYITLPKRFRTNLKVGVSLFKELGLDDNPRNLASVILHEVGHIFDYFTSITRTVLRSEVYYDVMGEVARSPNINSKKIIKILGLDNNKDIVRELDNAAKNKTKLGLSFAIAKQYSDELYSTVFGSTYGVATATEVAADTFSARFGYHKELAETMLVVTQSRYGTEYKALVIFGHAVTILSIIGIVVYSIAFKSLPGMGLPLIETIWVGLMFTYALFMMLYYLYCTVTRQGARRTNLINAPYPTLEDRIRNIRIELIKYANMVDLSKEEKEQLLSDLSAIDVVIKEVGKPFYIYEKIAYLTLNSVRTEETTIRFEQMLQDLANNRLTISAIELELASYQG